MGRAETAAKTTAATKGETVLCPYCGVPLFTARDRAKHLDIKDCCAEGANGWDCADLTDPHDRCCRRAATRSRALPRRAS
ncbi:hypothetical protein CKO11_10225 [Rhodobacter sp. TJ_12]|uniref:hypothetical protein n=1 Tax=Rhodobacter sp. TJ_12 TaxID=2029399 RepID=UPI001CBF3C0B|nr:hypothetical protein [Rhodobacter sp. TJ_12]MBZ4022835.1 hypothetical protein [Rhodobacter sp. TJ_12]